MSIFLERQKVRKRRAIARRLKTMERILFSAAVILAGLLALYGIYVLVFMGPIFTVKEIIIEGDLSQTTKEQILFLTGISEGENLFSAHVKEAHDRLTSHPWIREASVRRRLPRAVWVFVREYVPAAVVVDNGQAFYTDWNGVVFKPVEPGEPRGLPVISGVENLKDSGESRQKLAEVLKYISMYRNSSFGQTWGISGFSVAGSGGCLITTEKGPIQIFLGGGAFEERLTMLENFQGAVSRRGGRIKYILADDLKRITVGYTGS
jgi:cell division septal protein FtsQ